MGYYSHFKLTVPKDCHGDKIVYDGYVFARKEPRIYRLHGKLQAWEELMRSLSEEHPGMFVLDRHGEQLGDHERVYATGGDVSSVKGRVTYPAPSLGDVRSFEAEVDPDRRAVLVHRFAKALSTEEIRFVIKEAEISPGWWELVNARYQNLVRRGRLFDGGCPVCGSDEGFDHFNVMPVTVTDDYFDVDWGVSEVAFVDCHECCAILARKE